MTRDIAVRTVRRMEDDLTGGRFEIVVGVALGHDWSEWFDGFELYPMGDSTRLVGEISDQAALHGVLAILRDLALPILEVRRLADPPSHDRPNTPPGT